MFSRYNKPKACLPADKALLKLAQMCAQSEHCTSELYDKAISWGVPPDDAEKVIAKLVREHFADDSRYASFYVKDKARFNGWGPEKIRQQLKLKRIKEETIDDAIEALPSEEWDAILTKIMTSKIRSLTQDDPQKRFASAVRFGLQRGFPMNDVIRTYKRLNSDAPDGPDFEQ